MVQQTALEMVVVTMILALPMSVVITTQVTLMPTLCAVHAVEEKYKVIDFMDNMFAGDVVVGLFDGRRGL